MNDYLKIVNEWGKDESSFGCELESFEDFNESCIIELGIEANDELYQSYVDGYRIGWTDKEMDDCFGEKWYNVIKCAEDEISGYVKLTDKEAELIDYVTDSSNWKSCTGGGWCGSFIITPATKEEIDECGLND